MTDDEDHVHLQHVRSTLPLMTTVPFTGAPGVRFNTQGSRLLVTSREPTAAIVKVPVASAPETRSLLAMTELLLGQRLNEHGGWVDLTREEFFERQRLLTAMNWRLGPDPQVRIYR
jgi:hypothetical protein